MSESFGLYGAYFIADSDQIRENITQDLETANRSSGLAAIVFANAKKKFVQDEISPLITYWNYRSESHISLFFPGYRGNPSIGSSEYSPTFDPIDSFSEKTFVDIMKEVEEGDANWTYRGDTPIIIFRTYLQYDNVTREPLAFFDFSSIIQFELERSIRNGSIESVDKFFEAIIKAAKETPGDSVDWKLSARLGESALREALIDAVVSTLPSGARRVAEVFADFRPKSSVVSRRKSREEGA